MMRKEKSKKSQSREPVFLYDCFRPNRGWTNSLPAAPGLAPPPLQLHLRVGPGPALEALRFRCGAVLPRALQKTAVRDDTSAADRPNSSPSAEEFAGAGTKLYVPRVTIRGGQVSTATAL